MPSCAAPCATKVAGREAQRAAVLVCEGRFGLDPGAREQWRGLGEDAALGHGNDDRLGHGGGFTCAGAKEQWSGNAPAHFRSP